MTSDSSPEETLILSSILTTFEGFSFRLEGNLETSCIDGNFDESFTVRSLHVPEQLNYNQCQKWPMSKGVKWTVCENERSLNPKELCKKSKTLNLEYCQLDRKNNRSKV